MDGKERGHNEQPQGQGMNSTSEQSSESTLLPQTLRINAGDHLELDNLSGKPNDLLPYQHVRMLGHGGSASVEMVSDTNTGSVYARKVFKNVYSRNLKDAKEKLLNEVQIMQRLSSHHHIIRVHATYINKRELAIILDPVADGGDLATFLQNYQDSGYSLFYDVDRGTERRAQNKILQKAFGCLASELAFMHRQAIRHKDIKPQNILIHQGSVIYTDFGLSYDFGDIGQSTTTGLPQGITRRYCAPEVADWGSRNSKSDIFSLGCVFIEIHSALEKGPQYYNLLEGPYHEALRSEPGEVMFSYDWGFDTRFDMIRSMVRIDPSKRSSAVEIVKLLADGLEKGRHFCRQCIEANKELEPFATCCGIDMKSEMELFQHFDTAHTLDRVIHPLPSAEGEIQPVTETIKTIAGTEEKLTKHVSTSQHNINSWLDNLALENQSVSSSSARSVSSFAPEDTAEVHVISTRSESELSSFDEAHRIQENLSDISSLPPDPMLDGGPSQHLTGSTMNEGPHDTSSYRLVSPTEASEPSVRSLSVGGIDSADAESVGKRRGEKISGKVLAYESDEVVGSAEYNRRRRRAKRALAMQARMGSRVEFT
ncbi:kinase-like domain-containing protein [Pyrenochaeta sp. MPI-SDFR-AT-0127]|nr:kinase-like domain-containing protein [Pyrenochaeta sp. MPI-SDFR-AT-0127]